MVKVFTKRNCIQCKMTKRKLQELRVPFKEYRLENADAAEYVRQMGFMHAPVVITDDDSWSGFQPSKLEQLA